MTDQNFTGFRFEWQRPAPNGGDNEIIEARCLVVAHAEDEAWLIMVDSISGTKMGVQLIDQGAHVLEEARRHKIADGDGREVTA